MERLTADSSSPGPAQRNYAQVVVRLAAVLLFLIIAYLTLPKIAPRVSGIFRRGEARQQIWRKAAGKEKIAQDQIVRGHDVVLIAVVATIGGLTLVALAYFALRRL